MSPLWPEFYLFFFSIRASWFPPDDPEVAGLAEFVRKLFDGKTYGQRLQNPHVSPELGHSCRA